MATGTDREIELLECRTCGDVAIGRGELVCCEHPMESVSGADTGVEGPTLDKLLKVVFGMSSTELDVCLCVMEAGETTTSELAERIDYDRSVVSRHLNHLADIGVLSKRRRLLRQGGHVYVYTPVDVEDIRRHFKLGLYEWMREAIELIDDLSREKVEAIVELEESGDEWRIFEEQ